MARVKFGKVTRSRRKRWLKRAKGYYGLKKASYKKAHEQVVRSMAYAFIGRKERKRDFRRLWISRINAAVRPYGLSYSNFMHALKVANIEINRKMLSELAINNPQEFAQLVQKAQTTLGLEKTSPEIVKVKVPQPKKVNSPLSQTTTSAMTETVSETEAAPITLEEPDLESTQTYLSEMEVKYATQLKPIRSKKTVSETENKPAAVNVKLSLVERGAQDGSNEITETQTQLMKHALKLRSLLPETEKALLKVDLDTLTKKELLKYMRKVSNKLAK